SAASAASAAPIGRFERFISMCPATVDLSSRNVPSTRRLLVVAILLPELLAQLRIRLVHRGLAKLARYDVIVAAIGDIRRDSARTAAAAGPAADAASSAAALAALTLTLTLALTSAFALTARAALASLIA